jgi:Kef-type K+ transport system membrane component KefB
LIKTQEIDIYSILLLIAFALILARIFGYIFYRFKQPAVLGEILAGIVLGGIGLFLIHGQKVLIFNHSFILPDFNLQSNYFVFVAELGILFLLFVSGLEISVSKLKKMGKSSSIVAIGGVLAPFILGFLSCFLLSTFTNFNFTLSESIVIGLILTATSVGVTVRTLMDMNVLDSDVGATILGSAVIDDVIAIILLAFVVSIGSIFDTLWLGLRIALFFLIFLYLGLKLIDKILNIGEKINTPKAFLSIAIAILLIYAFFADTVGISGIIGAFVAGILIGQNVRSVKIEKDVKAIAYGFFIPLFFVWVGSILWKSVDDISSSSIISIIFLAVIISSVAIIGKILGCGIGAKIAGMSNRESLQVGIGMIPRMELALIIVTTAFTRNILTGDAAGQILVVTVLLTIITTLIAPVLIKITFNNE